MESLSLNTIHVLHVDDDPDFADMAATFLEKENERFIVETASSAAAGLERLGDEIDCIVSDYDMPGKDGIDFLESVRAECPDIPFILYTGKGSEEVASDAISAGVTDYLQKEIGADQYTVLANRIENAVRQTRSQEALAESEQRLSLFIEQSPLGVIEWNENFDVVQVNDTATDILGYTEAELEGKSWESIVVETDREQVEDVVESLLDAEGGYHSINKNQRKDGSTVTCEWHNRVISDDDGETLSIFSQFQDITSRKEHERELQVRATAMEAVTDGIAILDENQEFVFMNEAHAEIYGYDSPEALLGETWRACYDDVDTSWFESEILPELFETGEWRGEMDVTTADGRNIIQDLLLNVTADGRVVCVVREITEQKEHEARLEQSTARLQVLFEHSPDMINIHTADGTIVDVNQPFCKAFDRSKDTLIGRKVWDIDQQLNPDEMLEIWDTMEIGDRIELETKFQRDDGTQFPAEVHVTRLPVGDGDRFMVISRDITERKDRVREIQTLKERLELAVEGANLGVWDWDMTTDEVEFNEQWAAMLGYTLDELESHLSTWEARVHPDDIEDVKAALAAHIQQETDYYDTEHRMRTADGEWKWIRDLGKIVERDDDGEPIRAVGIHLNIDESKEYQRELEQKTQELAELISRLEEQYETLFEEAPVMAVITREQNGRPIIEDCNNQFAETLGFELETLIGTDLAEFYTPDSREALIGGNGYERSLEDEFTKESRELVAADGEIVEALLRAVPRKNTAGDVVGTLAMYIDITQREEVKRANERLEEFASIVSHDLRNPLNVAAGHLELARDNCESPHLESVERAHGRMGVLIEDLLTLAREGEDVTDMEAVNLTTVAKACWETVETAEASLTIESNRSVVADESRLRQLFENLIRNAVEHGGSTVAVTVGELEDGFYIEDDGPGIPEADAGSVFEAGYSTDAEGTGFGLSIVQRIAEAHEWDIRVTNGSQGGARFEIIGVEFTPE